MFAPSELEARLKSRESVGLEFKEAKTQFDFGKLCRYCVAIANEGGGELILGVTDRQPREVVGTERFADCDDTAKKLFAKLRFRIEVEAGAFSGKRIVLFQIPSRPRGTAYSYEGAYLMRSIDELMPMSEDRLRAIFAEGEGAWTSRPAGDECDGQDVVRLLDTQAYFDLLRLPYPQSRDGVLERFSSEGLIEKRGGRLAHLQSRSASLRERSSGVSRA